MLRILFIIFEINIFLVTPAYAYIDPATGSMLYSVVIGIVATLFFLLQTLFYKFKLIFNVSGRELLKNSIPFVVYSEGNQYWNVFKPVLEEFEKRKIPVAYYTSCENDLFFENKYEFIKGKFIGKQSIAFLKLAFLNADICLITTPRLEVMQLKRSKNCKHYSHILHAISEPITYRLFGLDYFDSVLLNGEFQIENIRKLENLRGTQKKDLEIVGCTYLDELMGRIKQNEKKEKYTVLLAPSWGENGILSAYGIKFLDKLVQEKNWNIIIRPHPQSLISEKKMIEKIIEHYKQDENIFFDFENDNFNSLSMADVLISDFSGIIYDFCFLFEKPFIFVDEKYDASYYDAADLNTIPLDRKIIHEIGKELKHSNFENIVELVKNLEKDDEIRKKIPEIKNVMWEKQGNSAKNVVDFLVRKQKEVTKC